MRLDYGLAVIAYVLLAFALLWAVDKVRVPGRRAVRKPARLPARPRGDRPA